MKFIPVRFVLFVLFAVVGLSSANIMQGEEIPTLKTDPAVKFGTLPNGLSWYVVKNTSVKGVADFAVVQLIGTATDSGMTREKMVEISQESLASKFHDSSSTVQDFFTRHGVVPAEGGFAKVEDNATVFRFNNVNLLQSSDVIDSSLLVLMNMIDVSSRVDDPLLKKCYSPSNQAIIVAGDVDQTVWVEKIRMLSYLIGKSEAMPRKKYIWKETDTMTVYLTPARREGLSEVSAIWRLQRTPQEYMNTVQPLVMERFMTELGLVAEKRLRTAFRNNTIPVGNISCRYKSGIETLGDESFSINVSVEDSDLVAAVSVVSEVMSSLNRAGANISEIRRAGNIYMNMLSKESKMVSVRNSDYISRCVSAFIYNAPLTTKKDARDFLQSRTLPDSTQVELFRSIASASIGVHRNLILDVATEDSTMTADSVKGVFEDVWTMAQEEVSVYDSLVYVPYLNGPSEKIRVKSVRKEYLSGGSLWTLSNGLRVIVKQMKTEGKVFYNLALNGGYGDIQGLAAGDGACLSDMMNFSTIGGVEADRFLSIIRQRGVDLNLDIDVSKTLIYGETEKTNLEYLFRVLQTFVYDLNVDEERLGYYLESLPLVRRYHKDDLSDRIAVIDSLMCPAYKYTAYHRYGQKTSDLKDKVEDFCRKQSSKINDGVLILVGEIDEKKLKEVLQNYGGGFKTSEEAFRRTMVNYQPLSGTVSYRTEGKSMNVDIAMSTPLSLTADNYYTSEIASMVLRRHFAKMAAGKGIHVRMGCRFERHPHERLGMMVSITEAHIEGFASGTVQKEPSALMSWVRNILSDMASVEIPDALLKSYKTRLKTRNKIMMTYPEYWINALVDRYICGKDLVTSAEAKIDAVTKEDIRDLLEQLSKDSRVEYIITR